MSEFQNYIDALRQGELFNAIKIIKAISEKYTKINNEGPLGQDELLPLSIFELCQTDINENDIKAFNTLYNYMCFHSLENGYIGYAAMTLFTATSVALSMKDNITSDSLSVLKKTAMKCPQDILDFTANNSFFSNLSSINQANQTITKALYQELDGRTLGQRITAMNKSTFNHFYDNVEELQLELAEMDAMVFDCPILADETKRRQELEKTKGLLIEAINLYKDHLSMKLEAHGIIVKDSECVDPWIEEKPSKISKLIKRYEIINALDLEKLDFNLEADITIIYDAISACKKNEPDWFERTFLQKITDIFSLGIRPLCRFFLSKEPKLAREIELLAENISQSVKMY